MRRLIPGLSWVAGCLLLSACTGGHAAALTSPTAVVSAAGQRATVFGAALEAAPSTHSLAGVRIQITDGPDAGTEAVSDSTGAFHLDSLKSGAIGILATKDGYQPWRVLNLSVDTYHQIQVVMYPTAPVDASGKSATARCNDGTWSWETSPVNMCAEHGGAAYVVCPGPLCVVRN